MTTLFIPRIHDSQTTAVTPIAPEQFDVEAYVDHKNQLHEGCRKFSHADFGILVYRRMRVGEVISSGCKNMEESLAGIYWLCAANLER